MQDTLLRVFVVTLGLLTCPRDEPGVEEKWDESITVGKQTHEESLLREDVKLDQEMAPAGDKITHTDDKGLQKNIFGNHKEQNLSYQPGMDKHKISVSDEATVTKQTLHQQGYADHTSVDFTDASEPQKFRGEERDIADQKMSHADQKPLGNLHSDMRREQGGAIRLQEQEAPEIVGSQEKEASLSDVLTKMSENDTSEKALTDWEEDFLWYTWNICSIISMIRFLWKYSRNKSLVKRDDTSTFPSVTCVAGEVSLPDGETLQRFHDKCVQDSPGKKWRQREFLEGFANHMVEAMRAICDRNGGMVIGDCQMLDACDITVPFTPPEPHRFQCLLWNNEASDFLPDMQVCGQIKWVENKIIHNGCPCQSSDADDTVCLLHVESEKVQATVTDVGDGCLCAKNTPFLSKSQVTRWFQSTIKQAWAQIAHKYDFELSIRYVGAPGALVVRFRSGKKVCFNMNPVVQFNAESHFYITPCSPNHLDTCWTLSLAIYEDHLLECLSKQLPENSCHIQTFEIAHFLHKKQTAVSGSGMLKEYHFKMALLHLLLTKDPSQWKPNLVACRLRDLLDFLEQSLEKKRLHHVFIGNPLTRKTICLPEAFTQAEPVNLFRPLVVHKCIYSDTVIHFQEMLRNTNMLIKEYVQY